MSTSGKVTDILRSPIPLDREEAENEAVRALAAKLAPAFEQADALFSVPEEFQRRVSSSASIARSEDDDDLDDEVEALPISEQLLRDELELANDFSNLFNSFERDDDMIGEEPFKRSSIDAPATPMIQTTLSAASSASAVEADVDVAEHETPEAKPSALTPIEIPAKGSPSTPAESTPVASNEILIAATPHNPKYTQSDHFARLRMRREERGGWYSVDLTPHLASTTNRLASTTHSFAQLSAVREYCLTIPETKLKHMFVGLPEMAPRSPLNSPSRDSPGAKVVHQQPPANVLPVRTLTMRMRGDVLCGAVMDAVSHGLTSPEFASTAEEADILKRQGGHLQAVIGGTTLTTTKDSTSDGQVNMETLVYPPFFLDAQLCTYKSDECERLLLVRIYHLAHDEAPKALATDDDNDEGTPLLLRSSHSQVHDTLSASQHVREACALVQRMESPRKAKRVRASLDKAGHLSTPAALHSTVTEHLLESYRACPSVKDGNITLPSLNSEDWPVIQSSWRWIRSIWDELETRDLTYNTLLTSRFGSFPALPTLDVHYCSQIRRLSREDMIGQLLKSASDLEEYAREAEYACANLIALLQPTFETYDVQPPSLPKATPLTAYPLDFVAPQQSCPPWGQKVMEALNEIQAMTGSGKSGTDAFVASSPTSLNAVDAQESLDMADRAVKLVLSAFQKQDDEEKSARLGRKNMQVMDRLSKMQEHQRLSILALDRSYLHSEQARRAADDFEAKSGIREVPLLKWSVLVGGSTGTCLVTANHILFVTQLIPVIGGSRTHKWNIREVEFHVQEGAVSLLNPLPTVISVTQNGQDIYNFRPSTGGARLKRFLDIVQQTDVEERGDEVFETPPFSPESQI